MVGPRACTCRRDRSASAEQEQEQENVQAEGSQQGGRRRCDSEAAPAQPQPRAGWPLAYAHGPVGVRRRVAKLATRASYAHCCAPGTVLFMVCVGYYS